MPGTVEKIQPTYPGLGLRLRREYIPQLLQEPVPVDWFEIIPESYFDISEEKLGQLEQIRERYPIVMHGISLGIGSSWPLDEIYLAQLKQLIERIEPAWISDHLSWSGGDDNQGQLLPLHYNSDTLQHLIPRIRQVQDYLGRQILLENVPIDRPDPSAEMAEVDFIREVAQQSDSLILLDIENLHTSNVNQDADCLEYLQQLPGERVRQIHLAGATVLCEADEAQQTDRDPIWQLYLDALKLFGPTATMIERLDTILPFPAMVSEVSKARCALNRIFPHHQSA